MILKLIFWGVQNFYLEPGDVSNLTILRDL